MRLRLERISSPLDPLLLVTDDDGALRALEFVDREQRMHRLLKLHYGEYVFEDGVAPRSIAKAINAYFAGQIHALEDVPVQTGGTSFQREVWKALREIPAGVTKSYGALAEEIGRTGSSRAVGAANGANPVGIVVPCHRVIGAKGTLTGYAGGVERKQWLLDHERRQLHLANAKTLAIGSL